MVSLPGPEPGGPYVRVPVVLNTVYRQVPSLHGLPYHRPAPVRGDTSSSSHKITVTKSHLTNEKSVWVRLTNTT